MSKIDPALFRETLGHYPTGVAVVTAITEDGLPTGMVVGTFSSVSLDPPLVAFFPAATSKSFASLRNASAFCVNVLASDQEPVCRRFATSGVDKFDGVQWHAGSLGAPILDGVVSWIECTFEEIREAGDHYIVLGRVHELAVQRSTLPLLFFQGGYGRFSPGSFIAGPDPDLIHASQLAEAMRHDVEELSTEFGVDCSVLARIRGDAVMVLSAVGGSHSSALPLGHRQPIIPPMGAVFLIDSAPDEVDEWLQRAPAGDDRGDLYRTLLDSVRRRGYSLLVFEPERMRRHETMLSEFELADRLPRQENAVRQSTSDLADLFSPELEDGEHYDLATIVVPVLVTTTEPGAPGYLPAMAIRMNAMPMSASKEQIELWVEALKRVAANAAKALTQATTPGTTQGTETHQVLD